MTELGFQLWLPVQEAAGRPEARPRRRCCSEFNHLGHVGRTLVGANEVHHQEAQFVENSRLYRQPLLGWVTTRKTERCKPAASVRRCAPIYL